MSTVALGIYLQPQHCTISFVNENGHCLGSASQDMSVNTASLLIKACETLQAQLNLAGFNGIGLVCDGMECPEGLLKELADHFQMEVAVSRAGLALAAYEQRWGHATTESNFMGITMHAAIDGGIVLNGQKAAGEAGLAGTIAHLLVHENGESRPLGDYFSPKGICNLALKVMANEPIGSSLRLVPASSLTPNLIIEAAMAQDKIALHVIEQLGEILGLKLSDMINYFSPSHFILSSFSKQFTDLVVKAASVKMEESVFPVFKEKVTVLSSKSQGADYLSLQAAAIAF